MTLPPLPKATMRLRVLGQLEVIGHTRTIRTVARRERIVLAVLALDANHVVSMDRLVDAVWDENPPATAREQIQICVSALRRALLDAGLADVILTHPAGYLLRAGEGELDLDDFDHLVAVGKLAAAEGRLTDAADAFAQALALWDGGAFSGLDSRIVQAAAAQLVERRLEITEQRFDALLRLGSHHEIIGELMALTVEYPLRETLRVQLMTALYRDGRKAEALAVYQQARRVSIDELGLEPGATLQNLEQAILTGDAALAPPPEVSAHGFPRAPRMLPPDIADFTGRRDELAQIRRLLLQARAGDSTPTVVMITGRGGVGKTTLALHVAHALAQSFPGGQLFASFVGGGSRRPGPSDVLGRFLRVLGVPGPAIPEGTEARASVYRDRLGDRRVLIILDDAESEEEVLPLLPGHSTAAVIVTSRMRLTGLSAAHVEVGLFPEQDAIGLLEQVAGTERVRADAASSEALVALCGRLPLALRIAAARLAARPHWPVAQLVSRLADEGRRLDELTHHSVDVRASIATMHDRLGSDARRLFRRLGLIKAPDFARWLPMPLLSVSQEKAEDLLDVLADARLLDVVQGSDGSLRYQFHDLIRVFAREQLAKRESRHQRLAAVRRMLGAWLYLAREAHSREYGGDYTVLHGAAEVWPLPHSLVDAEIADPLSWYEAERVALTGAVRQAADSGLHEICWDLAMSTVVLFETRSYLDDWRDTHDVALAASRRAGNRRGEAAMLYSLGALTLCEGRFDQAGTMLERALTAFSELGDSHGRALTERNLAHVDRVHGEFGVARTRYENALATLREAGDVVAEAHALIGLAHIAVETNEYGEAEATLGQAFEIAHRAGGSRVAAQARTMLGEIMLDRGDLPGARNAFLSVLTWARAARDLMGEANALAGLSTIELQAGELLQAELLLGQALRIAQETRDQLLVAKMQLARGRLSVLAGRWDEAVVMLADARARFDRLGAEPWSALARKILSDGPPAG